MGKADVFTGMSLTEKLIWLKKFGNGGGSTPTYADRTATGNPVIFTTNFAQNAKALSVDFAPKQNLNGYSKPWVGGAGKNLLWCNTLTTHTESGITFTQNPDGSIHVKGTATASVVYYLFDRNGSQYNVPFPFPNGTYIISGGHPTMYLTGFAGKNSSATRFNDNGEGATFTISDGYIYQVRLVVYKGTTADIDIYPMIRLASISDDSYEPYENICPITGIDSIDVVANSNTHEFDLGRTVYGGILNAKTGVLSVDRAMIDLGSLSWAKASDNRFNSAGIKNLIEAPLNASTAVDAKCSSYEVLAFDVVRTTADYGISVIGKNSSNVGQLSIKDINHEDPPNASDNWLDGVMFVYKLATPQTYQLTAQEIALLEGENVIATDGDNLNVTYQVKV